MMAYVETPAISSVSICTNGFAPVSGSSVTVSLGVSGVVCGGVTTGGVMVPLPGVQSKSWSRYIFSL